MTFATQPTHRGTLFASPSAVRARLCAARVALALEKPTCLLETLTAKR